MKMFNRLALTLFASFFTLTVHADDTPKLTPGAVQMRSYDFKEADKKMDYGLYLPKDFDQSKTYPLIVALHGLNSNPGQILSYPGFTKHADDSGTIIVAPTGYNKRGWYGSLGKGRKDPADPKNLGELSEKDVMNVLELTRKQFKIDENRITIFGHSMGGGGGIHLAIKYPEIWAAVAVVAPAAFFPKDGLKAAKDIPMIVVQGDKDNLVDVKATRAWIEKMKELGMTQDYIEVEGGGHVFVAWQHFDEIFKFYKDHPKK